MIFYPWVQGEYEHLFVCTDLLVGYILILLYWFMLSGASHRSHSMNNLLEPTSQSEDFKCYTDISTMRRASADLRPVSPLPSNNGKIAQKTYSEIPVPAVSQRRGSADVRLISPLPDRRAESHFESKVEHKTYELSPPAPPLLNSPLPERKVESRSEVRPFAASYLIRDIYVVYGNYLFICICFLFIFNWFVCRGQLPIDNHKSTLFFQGTVVFFILRYVFDVCNIIFTKCLTFKNFTIAKPLKNTY